MTKIKFLPTTPSQGLFSMVPVLIMLHQLQSYLNHNREIKLSVNCLNQRKEQIYWGRRMETQVWAWLKSSVINIISFTGRNTQCTHLFKCQYTVKWTSGAFYCTLQCSPDAFILAYQYMRENTITHHIRLFVEYTEKKCQCGLNGWVKVDSNITSVSCKKSVLETGVQYCSPECKHLRWAHWHICGSVSHQTLKACHITLRRQFQLFPFPPLFQRLVGWEIIL